MSQNNRTQYIAYITTQKERVLSSSGLSLYAETEEECSILSIDLAKSLKCDIVQLTCGDYLLINVPK